MAAVVSGAGSFLPGGFTNFLLLASLVALWASCQLQVHREREIGAVHGRLRHTLCPFMMHERTLTAV